MTRMFVPDISEPIRKSLFWIGIGDVGDIISVGDFFEEYVTPSPKSI